jgi:hypothetical protein
MHRVHAATRLQHADCVLFFSSNGRNQFPLESWTNSFSFHFGFSSLCRGVQEVHHAVHAVEEPLGGLGSHSLVSGVAGKIRPFTPKFGNNAKEVSKVGLQDKRSFFWCFNKKTNEELQRKEMVWQLVL